MSEQQKSDEKLSNSEPTFFAAAGILSGIGVVTALNKLKITLFKAQVQTNEKEKGKSEIPDGYIELEIPKQTHKNNAYVSAMDHFWRHTERFSNFYVGNCHHWGRSLEELLRPVFNEYTMPDHLKKYDVGKVFDDSLLLVNGRLGGGCGEIMENDKEYSERVHVYKRLLDELLFDDDYGLDEGVDQVDGK